MHWSCLYKRIVSGIYKCERCSADFVTENQVPVGELAFWTQLVTKIIWTACVWAFVGYLLYYKDEISREQVEHLTIVFILVGSVGVTVYYNSEKCVEPKISSAIHLFAMWNGFLVSVWHHAFGLGCVVYLLQLGIYNLLEELRLFVWRWCLWAWAHQIQDFEKAHNETTGPFQPASSSSKSYTTATVDPSEVSKV